MLEKILKRERRHARVRARISGTILRPRLAVFRSATHIYAQLIDDTAGHTLCSMSDIKSTDTKATKTTRASEVGRELARRAKELKIETCVFDRGGNLYAGRVKALADGAREGGLQF